MFPALFLDIFPKKKTFPRRQRPPADSLLRIRRENIGQKENLDEKEARSQCHGGVIEWRPVHCSLTLMVISCTMSEGRMRFEIDGMHLQGSDEKSLQV